MIVAPRIVAELSFRRAVLEPAATRADSAVKELRRSARYKKTYPGILIPLNSAIIETAFVAEYLNWLRLGREIGVFSAPIEEEPEESSEPDQALRSLGISQELQAFMNGPSVRNLVGEPFGEKAWTPQEFVLSLSRAVDSATSAHIVVTRLVLEREELWQQHVEKVYRTLRSRGRGPRLPAWVTSTAIDDVDEESPSVWRSKRLFSALPVRRRGMELRTIRLKALEATGQFSIQRLPHYVVPRGHKIDVLAALLAKIELQFDVQVALSRTESIVIAEKGKPFSEAVHDCRVAIRSVSYEIGEQVAGVVDSVSNEGAIIKLTTNEYGLISWEAESDNRSLMPGNGVLCRIDGLDGPSEMMSLTRTGVEKPVQTLVYS